MLLASQLKNNTIFEYDNEPYRVLSYKHTHLARGSADVRVKIKGLISGKVLSENFSPDDRFDQANLVRQKMQYLYADEDNIILMSEKTYEQGILVAND